MVWTPFSSRRQPNGDRVVPLGCDAAGKARFQAPIRSQYRHLMTSPSHGFGQCANFYGRAAKFQEGSIGLCDVQDSHSSRKIFFSDFANTLNLKSRFTRSRPRAPISRARSGFANSVSIEVASCGASPCCTR